MEYNVNPVIVEKLVLIAQAFGLSYSDLIRQSKNESIARVRHACFDYLHGEYRITLMQIGVHFNRHYSSIIYGRDESRQNRFSKCNIYSKVIYNKVKNIFEG